MAAKGLQAGAVLANEALVPTTSLLPARLRRAADRSLSRKSGQTVGFWCESGQSGHRCGVVKAWVTSAGWLW